MNTGHRQRLVFGLAMLTAAVVAFAAYSDMLRYGFTATDTYTLIATGRIAGFHDVLRVFTEPLMGNTDFAARCLLYRPISSLSFGLDYAVWGLDPFGYHLTDLLLHVLVTLLVFLVVYRLIGNRSGPALLAALLFTIHPVLVETVPAISRRQDILAAFFLLLALLGVIEGDQRRRRAWTFAAVVAYVLALGSKEIAIVLPLIVVIYGALAETRRQSAGWLRGLRMAVPYLVATAFVFAWRLTPLHELGGVAPAQLRPAEWLAASVNTAREFASDLLYPVSLAPASWERLLVAIAPYMLLVGGTVLLAVLFAARRRVREYLDTNPFARRELFFLLWLLLLLLLLVSTCSFSHRCMYLAAVPFSAGLALVLTDGARGLRQRFNARALRHRRKTPGALSGREVAFPAAVILTVYLVAFSPLVRTYSGWRESADLTECFFKELAALLPALPNNATLHVYGFPRRFSDEGRRIPQVQSVTFPADYTIESWIELKRPGSEAVVHLDSRIPVPVTASAISLDTKLEGTSDVHVAVRID